MLKMWTKIGSLVGPVVVAYKLAFVDGMSRFGPALCEYCVKWQGDQKT
jgi:hypothetical protein